jgi:hypothetical protein
MEDVVNEDIFSGQLNQALAHGVARGTSALQSVPDLLKKIIKEDRWRSYTAEMSGRQVAFSTFRGFVLAQLPDGLESNFVDYDSEIAADAAESGSLDSAKELVIKDRLPHAEEEFKEAQQ